MLLRPLLAKCLTNTHHGIGHSRYCKYWQQREGDNYSPARNQGDFQQALFDQFLLELCMLMLICARSWFVVGVEMTYFSLLMCFLFSCRCMMSNSGQSL